VAEDGGMDFAGAMQKLKTMMSTENGKNQIKGVLSALSGRANDAEEARSDTYEGKPSSGAKNIGGDIDYEAFAKMKNMFSAASDGNNHHARFLTALAPYLSESRRGKVDSAIKIMNMMKIAKMMKTTNKE
jgi:hypothetical protein